MSKTTKIKAIVVMLLASALMFVSSAFAIGFERISPINAEQQKLFVMSDEIEARMTNPSGLRFTTYINDATKTEALASKEFGFIIAPAINFENATSTDYLADGAMVDKAVVVLSPRKFVEVGQDSKYYSANETRYYVNAVLYNIQEKNWYLDFSAVAYYVTQNGQTVYTANAQLPKANIGDIVEKEFFSEDGDSETRGQLLENFNYGGTQPKTVNTAEVGEYTIPAHAIPVNNDNVVSVVTLPDNAYSFKLTENVVVNNQNIQEGSQNIISGFDTFLMANFDGVLDGNGYDFVISIHTNNRPTRGVFAKDLNGTIKNLNLIVRAETWSSGNSELGSVIWNLNGTIENCVITAKTHRFGSTNWTLNWAMIESSTENAVIKNSVFNNIGDMATKFIRTPNEATTISNVAIVNDKAWDDATIKTIPSIGNIEDLYLYSSPAALIAGTPAYKYDGSAFVATGDKKAVGLDLALANVTVRAGQNGQNADGIFTDVEETLNVPVMMTEETAIRSYIFVDNAADLVTALRTNKRVILTADIVINNKNASTDDKIASVIGHVVEGTYTGVLDGNGHNLTINIGGTTRSNGILFNILDGTVKNLNAVISFEGWGSGNYEHYGSFIGTLNGTVENCVVTVYNRRFGNATLTYSPIRDAGADAVVKNSVFYNAGPINTGKLIYSYVDAAGKPVTNPTTTIENVIVIDNAWTDADINSIKLSPNMNNVYLVDGIDNAMNGKIAYKYNGSSFVASSETINVKEIFGFNIAKTDREMRYIAYNNGNYGADVVEKIIVPVTYKKVPQDVVVKLSSSSLKLTDKDTTAQLTATVTKGGVAVDSSAIIWKSSDESVVTVSNGTLTRVGFGSATISITYYGLTATCEVTVEEFYEIVTTAAEFVSKVKGNTKVKLGADIVINNAKSSELDKITAFEGSVVTSAFSGVLDGNGYTLTINAGTTSRPNGILFTTLNGTLQNINVIIRSNNWGSGNTEHLGSLVGTLNGTVKNSVINLFNTCFSNNNGNYYFARETSADAVVSNVVVLNGGARNSTKFIYQANADMTIENVAFVDSALTTAPVLNNVNGLYFFASIDDVVDGKVAYEYVDGAMVESTSVIDFENTFGYALTKVNSSVIKVEYNNGNYGADVVEIVSTLFMYDTEIAKTINVSLDKTQLDVAEGSGAIQLIASIIKNGQAISPTLSWTSSNDKVATVNNGLVTIVGAGYAKIEVAYYGKVACCEINVEPNSWTVVDSAEALFTAVQENKAIKLNADIVIKARYYGDGISSMTTYLANEFNGIIDGQGYTLTVMISDLRPACGLFVTLNGTLKNLNVVLLRSDWGDNNKRNVGFITNLNGVVDNCTFTTRCHRWNINYNIVWSFVENVGQYAIIKNTVFNGSQSELNGILTNVEKGATIKNVAFVVNSDNYANLLNQFPASKGNYSNVYFFGSVYDLTIGKTGNAIVDGAIVEVSENIDVEEVFGSAISYSDITYSVQLKASAVDNGTYTDVTISVPKFAYSVCQFTGHNYGDWTTNGDGTHSRVCLNDSTHVETEECFGGQATCDGQALCEECGGAHGDVLGHKYGEWISNGAETHVKVCEHDSNHVIANSHEFVNDVCVVCGEKSLWKTVTTAEEFVSLVQTNANTQIKLGADITISNKSVSGGFSNIAQTVASEFNGIIDGQGHIINLIMLEAGRFPVDGGGMLFNTMAGAIKNTNVVVSAYYWGDDSKRYPGVIGTLDGTVEDCIFTLNFSRFGNQVWQILWCAFNNTTENAVVKNVAIFDAKNDLNYKFAKVVDTNTTIENLAIINTSWASAQVTSTVLSSNTSNAYLFTGVSNFISGVPTYAYDSSTSTFASTSENINVNKLLGYQVVSAGITAYNGASSTETTSGYIANATTVTAPVFTNSSSVEYVVVKSAEEFYTAIHSNTGARIKLNADIVLNNKNITVNPLASLNDSFLNSSWPFTGVIDGQGHTLTINVNTTDRANGVLFGKLTGIIKNLNVVIRTNNWGSGNKQYLGSFIGTMAGTIDNCSVTMYHTRFGSAWNLAYAIFHTLENGAYVNNSAFYLANDISVKLAHEVKANASISNVAIVDQSAWTDTNIASIITTCNIDGLYLFNSLDDLASGKVAYAYNGSSIVASTQIVKLDVVKATAIVRAGTYADSIFSDSEQVIGAVKLSKGVCEFKGHVYGAWESNGDGTHTRRCIADANHVQTDGCYGGQATCDGKAICTACGGEYGTALGHKFGEWVSNGNGTHTSTCVNDASHVITENCAKGDVMMPINCPDCAYVSESIPGAIKFNTFNYKDGVYYGYASSADATFNFSAEINTSNGYIVCEDIGEMPLGNVVSITYGENFFYVIETVQGARLIYKVCIARVEKCEVTFMVDGQEIYSTIVGGGLILTDIPEIPEKEGFDVVGWDYDFSNPITQPTVINAVYKGKANIPYKVEYFFETKINSGATKESSMTQNLMGIAGQTVTVTPPVVDNYALNTEKSMLSAEIAGDGSLVMEIYYYSTQIASNAMFAETDIDLVSYGSSAYKIVVPKNTAKYVTFAATELQSLFFRATGITLEIITETNDMSTYGYYLSLGDTVLRKQAGTTAPTTGVKDEYFIWQDDVQLMGKEGAFAIQRVNNTVVMIGIDDYGTVFAAYEFLEKQLNYRYYAADTIVIDEVVNEKLIDINWSYTPYSIRNHATDRMSTDEAALRYGVIRTDREMNFPHSWMYVLPYDTYGAEHPEWYNDVHNGLCLTNAEMAKEYAKQVLIAMDTTGYATHMAGQMDEWSSHCSCANCTASDNLYTDAGTNVIFINRVCAEIDRLLAEQGRPNFRYRIVMLAYYQFEEPPTELNRQYNYNNATGYDSSKGYGLDIVKGPDGNRLTLHPNAGVHLCPFRFADASTNISNDPINTRTLSEIEAWKEFLRPNGNALELYIYRGYFPTYYLAFPFDFASLKDWIVYAEESGSLYNVWSISQQTQFEAMRAYVHGQLCYDITQSTDDLIEEFMNAYYKDAAPFVKQFFEEINSYCYSKGFTLPTDAGSNSAKQLYKNAANWSEEMLTEWTYLFDNAYDAIEQSDYSVAEKEILNYRVDMESLWPRYWLFKYYGDVHYTTEEYEQVYKEIVKLVLMAGYAEEAVVPPLTEDHYKPSIEWSTDAWEIGRLDTSTGQASVSSSRLSPNGAITKDFYKAVNYKFTYQEGVTTKSKYQMFYYDENYNFISASSTYTEDRYYHPTYFKIPEGAVYMKVMIYSNKSLTHVTQSTLEAHYTQLLINYGRATD